MFFIYSLKLNDLVIQLYDFCQEKEAINGLLDSVAKKFILREEGERHAENPYHDTGDVSEDGYFLKHSSEAYKIDVFQRKVNVLAGKIWSSVDVTCKKVMYFSVVDAPFELALLTPPPKKFYIPNTTLTFISELKNVLNERNLKATQQES